jgi:glucan phosphoethanolaminetransferase (alkaline phosphatase superfamily)
MNFLKVAFFAILLSLIFIITYQHTFNISPKIIVFHVFLVILLILLLMLWGYLLIFFEGRFINIVYGLTWGSFIILLLIAYGLAWGGKMILGTPLTIKIFWVYLTHFRDSMKSLGISFEIAFCFFLFFSSVIFSSFIYFAGSLLKDLRFFKKNVYLFLTNNSKIAKKLKTALLTLIIFILTFLVFFFTKHGLLQRLNVNREPLSLVFIRPDFQGMNFSTQKESGSIRTAYPKIANFKRKNVILIIVDALRADYLNMYGYPSLTSPFLNSLLKKGDLRKIDYAFSTSASSFPGILSILRSKSWYNLSLNNFSIYELLKDQGYRTNFILSGDHTNFYGLKFFYGKNVDYYFDGIDSKKYFINDDLLLFEGLEKIPNYQTISNFFYFHVMSVHSAGLRHSDNIKYLPANATDFDTLSFRNNYKNGILQADKYIKNIFKQLDKKGYLSNSIVVITADHGDSVGERGYYNHGHHVYNDEIRIPILIYDTDKSFNYHETKPAIQPDISATIVDRLGLPIPPSWEGKSLLKNDYREFSFHKMIDNFAIINYQNDKMYKYCFNKSTKKEEVFELRSDMNETHNILKSTDKKLLKQLRIKMKEFVAKSDK